MDDFVGLMGRAAGVAPYPYQTRIAEDGLPELLAVPTGCGKTAAVVLGWLWRRRFHPDAAVRKATPHWLVVCLPMRVLTEQVEADVRRWLDAVGLAVGEERVEVHVAMGGRERAEDRWRLEPERDAVVIGTLDMLVSRALNRGYGASRFAWPIDFGLLHNGCHWVFDEVQLMGPALATTRQLEGLRRSLGTVVPTSSTWMSATVDLPALATVDNPAIASTVELSDGDRQGGLGSRLDASKTVREVQADPKRRAVSIAEVLVAEHRAGTLTVAVLNTVRSAREVYAATAKLAGEVPVVLLHSRFRPGERARQVAAALAPVDPGGAGRFVVSTQVLEAGVDLSAAVLLTEVAPWPSMVQRAGRCNRDGETFDARLLWAEPTRPEPYEPADVTASVGELRALEAAAVTSVSLREREVPVSRPVYAILRRRDLLGLFDTAPDLSGNDVDVAPFIRLSDDLDALMAWRLLHGGPPGPDDVGPAAEELCPVPLGRELRDMLTSTAAWRLDHLKAEWVRANAREVRPGMVLVLDSAAGGYRPEVGWDPSSSVAVPPIDVVDGGEGLVTAEEPLGADPVTFASGAWVQLRQHLSEVEAAVRDLSSLLAGEMMPAGLSEAAAVAGRLHDVGKAHPVFQDTMLRCADDGDRAWVAAGVPWAKAGGRLHARHSRRFFRHELASALALLGEASCLLDDVEEADLVVYLVAAHHGRVRLGIRTVADEEQQGTVLGIIDGEKLPAVDTPGGSLPASTLSLGVMALGRDDNGTVSWTERALTLLAREDLGPFRLSFLEALVRLADWRASAAAREG